MPDLRIYRRRLPHIRPNQAIYFVTWRIALSQSSLTPKERTLITAALRHFEGVRYELLAFVVMDDHIHVIASPIEAHRLEDIVRSWKSYTANRLQRVFGRRGHIWQSEYFDRVVRDEEEFVVKAQYILNNPKKRWPEMEGYPWVWAYGVEGQEG